MAATNPPPPGASATPPSAQKPVWPWILGGCLILIIITLIGLGILGWLGLRSAKNMIQKYQPTIDQTQQNIDKFNQEAQQWEQKSADFRNTMPNPEDLQKMQGDLSNPQNFPVPTDPQSPQRY